jgi:hypothetical protein
MLAVLLRVAFVFAHLTSFMVAVFCEAYIRWRWSLCDRLGAVCLRLYCSYALRLAGGDIEAHQVQKLRCRQLKAWRYHVQFLSHFDTQLTSKTHFARNNICYTSMPTSNTLRHFERLFAP